MAILAKFRQVENYFKKKIKCTCKAIANQVYCIQKATTTKGYDMTAQIKTGMKVVRTAPQIACAPFIGEVVEIKEDKALVKWHNRSSWISINAVADASIPFELKRVVKKIRTAWGISEKVSNEYATI